MSDLTYDSLPPTERRKAIRLPNKPSELLMVALEDLERIEAMPDKYYVDMSVWHEPSDGLGVQCRVCLAGSVMALRDGLTPSDEATPYSFSLSTRNKLKALNMLRQWNVIGALHTLGLATVTSEHIRDLFEAYWFSGETVIIADLSMTREGRPEWKQYMQDLIGILAAEGL